MPGRKVAVLLLVVPGLLYAAALGVPFSPLAAEVVFWGAALFFGKEVVSRYRLTGYLKRRKVRR